MPRPKKLGLPEFQTPARQKLEQPLKICSPLVGANPKIVAVVTRCFHTGTNTSKKGMALAKRPMLAIPKKTSNTVQLIQPTANSFSSLSPPKNDSNPTWPRVVNRSKKAISNKNNAMKAITWHRKKKKWYISGGFFVDFFFSHWCQWFLQSWIINSAKLLQLFAFFSFPWQRDLNFNTRIRLVDTSLD